MPIESPMRIVEFTVAHDSYIQFVSNQDQDGHQSITK